MSTIFVVIIVISKRILYFFTYCDIIACTLRHNLLDIKAEHYFHQRDEVVVSKITVFPRLIKPNSILSCACVFKRHIKLTVVSITTKHSFFATVISYAYYGKGSTYFWMKWMCDRYVLITG